MVSARSVLLIGLSALMLVVGGSPCPAAPPVVQTLAEGLEQPTALALRPSGEGEPDVLFVALASEIHQLVVRQGEASPLRPLSIRVEGGAGSLTLEDKQPADKPVVTSLHFVNRDAMLMAGRRRNRHERSLNLVTLPTDIEARQAIARSSTREPAEAATLKVPGGYFALTSNERQAYAVLKLDDDAHAATHAAGVRLLRTRLASNMLGPLTPLETARRVLDVGFPVSVAASPDGYVVALYQGKPDGPSQLVFLDPELRPGAGKPVAMPLDLTGVGALAYRRVEGTERQQLFALASDGLYRIDAALDANQRMFATATRLVEIDSPTAMAHSPGGAIYVTTDDATTGDAKADDGAKTGRLMRITLE